MKKIFVASVLTVCSFLVGCGGGGPVEVPTNLPPETEEELKVKEQLNEDYKDEDRSQRMKDE